MNNCIIHIGTTILLCLVLKPLTGQQVVLNISDQIVNSDTPNESQQVTYNVTEKLDTCIQFYAATPGNSAEVLNAGMSAMSVGQPASVICTAILNSVRATPTGHSFSFSPGCAENNKTSAEVQLEFLGEEASTSMSGGEDTEFFLNLPESSVLTVNSDNVPSGATNQRHFLKLDASEEQTARISIDFDTNRGHCLVAIITPGKRGKTLAVLDPKSQNSRTFVVDQTVYIVPFIQAKVINSGSRQELIYEIGDPKRNGRIIVEEAG